MKTGGEVKLKAGDGEVVVKISAVMRHTDCFLGTARSATALKRLVRQAVKDCRAEQVYLQGVLLNDCVDGAVPVSDVERLYCPAIVGIRGVSA